MFSVKENDCVGFDSIWTVKKVYAAGSSQTTEFATRDAEINTTLSNECDTQTDEPVRSEPGEVDMTKLTDWLTKMYPRMSKELNETVNSMAFKNYRLSDDPVQAICKLSQTLKVHNDFGDGDIAYRVCTLSWNSTGNTLAVGCNHVHKTWCHHSGLVCLYTFDRNDKLPDIPRKKLTTETCVTVVRFHPSLAFIIAGGTYSGEIIIWNTQYDEGDNIVCKINGHEEGLTNMSWITDVDVAKTLLLATSSIDGFLNLWKFRLPASSITIYHKYKIKTPVLPRSKRVTNIPEEIAKKVARGIISFDFSPYIPDIFIVGCEGGLVAQCSVLGTMPLKGSTKDIPISDPVYKYYESHEGEVTKVGFSPNHKNMFFTCGMDGQLRIYILGQDDPARIIFLDSPLSSISWVPFHDKIITGCGSKGLIEIFKLISRASVEVVTDQKIKATNLTHMELNHERVSTVAVGNDKGILQIWSVPWHLYSY